MANKLVVQLDKDKHLTDDGKDFLKRVKQDKIGARLIIPVGIAGSLCAIHFGRLALQDGYRSETEWVNSFGDRFYSPAHEITDREKRTDLAVSQALHGAWLLYFMPHALARDMTRFMGMNIRDHDKLVKNAKLLEETKKIIEGKFKDDPDKLEALKKEWASGKEHKTPKPVLTEEGLNHLKKAGIDFKKPFTLHSKSNAFVVSQDKVESKIPRQLRAVGRFVGSVFSTKTLVKPKKEPI